MGRDRYSASVMADRRATVKSAAFDFSKRVINRGGSIHPALAPWLGGLRRSQNFDGTVARPVTLILDVTGSNRIAAKKVHSDLPQFFNIIHTHEWVPDHMQLQLGFVGDATCDQHPLQLTQFEGGSKIDQWLELAILEGGGGGQTTESYELMFWALCNQNKLDIWETGGKGDLIFVFDELPYPQVSARQLKSLYDRTTSSVTVDDGDVELSAKMKSSTLDELDLPEHNIPLEEIVEELKSKYNVWAIICADSGYYGDRDIMDPWEKMFGVERVISLPDADDISEMTAAILAAHYGADPTAIIEGFKELGTIGDQSLRYLKEAAVKVSSLAPVSADLTLNRAQVDSDAGYL